MTDLYAYGVIPRPYMGAFVARALARLLVAPGGPATAVAIAEGCGLKVRHSPVLHTFRRGRTIYVSPADELDEAVAHELGHWALESAGMPNTEDRAHYIAAGVLEAISAQPRPHLRLVCNRR